MIIEGLGKKFQQARMARNLSLEDAARMTKIRPSRLAEIEAEDFSDFPSLAYAKGFLIIYGKFLEVDVTPYLEAFEGSSAMTVDGYSYLQDNPAPKPVAPVVRIQHSRASLKPLFVGIFVLVVGLAFIRLILDISRIAPRRSVTTTQATPPATATPHTIVAPHALPADSPSVTRAVVANSSTPAPTSTPENIVATSSPETTQPEVRRAEPVSAADLARANVQTAAANATNQLEIRPLRRTYVKVIDNKTGKVIERWINPGEAPLRVQGQHLTVRLLDRDAVLLRKNGKRLADGDADVTVE